MTSKTIIGKTYKCNDPRDGGRTGEVVELEGDRARLRWSTGRRSWVRVERLCSPAFSEVSTNPDDYMLGYRLYVDSLRTAVSDAAISDCANSEQRKGWLEAERQEHSDPEDSVGNPPWSGEDDA